MEENAVEVFTCPLISWCKFSVGWQGYVTMETIWKNIGGFVYDCLIDMLLVSRSILVEDNAVEVFHHYVLFPLDANFQLVGRATLLWRRYGRIQGALYMID